VDHAKEDIAPHRGRRMLAYYEQGNRAIPRVVALAGTGLSAKALINICGDGEG
jgi:hypothetical protein